VNYPKLSAGFSCLSAQSFATNLKSGNDHGQMFFHLVNDKLCILILTENSCIVEKK